MLYTLFDPQFWRGYSERCFYSGKCGADYIFLCLFRCAAYKRGINIKKTLQKRRVMESRMEN